uniref:Uncharacterized protein n=1 Tax=Nelumbo nucifera TaxID=4432 RepID=A0A822Z532_NELNU|nr:TPA_asm: hypothetical protein HUJ06_014023 [Nelumbo nucifera]
MRWQIQTGSSVCDLYLCDLFCQTSKLVIFVSHIL